MFLILVCVPFCCTTLPYRRLSLSKFSTNNFSTHVYISVFVEKGLSPQNLETLATWEVSVASKYDPADYSTVHHCARDSLLRFRFLLGSETQ